MTEESASEKPVKQIQAPCPRCAGSRMANVLGHTFKRINYDGGWDEYNYRMLSCCGCGKVYLHESHTEDGDYFHSDGEIYFNEEVKTLPPTAKRIPPKWMREIGELDEVLKKIFDETYNCVNSDSAILAAVGTRTIFDRAAELLRIDEGQPFAKKLAELYNQGKIGDAEKTLLAVLTDAGGAAAHRGWSPTVSELNTLLDIVEGFVFRALILEKRVGKLRLSIPARKKALPASLPPSKELDDDPPPF